MEKLEKTTFRLPEWELARLREQSRRQRRSLNSVAADVLARGLSGLEGSPEASDLASMLGPLLVRPAQGVHPVQAARPPEPGLVAALDWSRGER